jgi:hypothetical protein
MDFGTLPAIFEVHVLKGTSCVLLRKAHKLHKKTHFYIYFFELGWGLDPKISFK